MEVAGGMAVIIKSDEVKLAHKGVDIFSRIAGESVALRGRFVVALSGGSTPRLMHRLWVEEPHLSKIPWRQTHIFWVDERCVPRTHKANNYGAAKADFLGQAPIPKEQIHPMPVDISPEKGAIQYQHEIADFFQPSSRDVPVFDLIFLGLGTDGHTASLFPGQRSLTEEERWVVSVRGGSPNVQRLTMTLPLLNSAAEIVFTVSGKSKAMMLKTVFDEPEAQLPSQKIQPRNGNLTWLLDRGAASLVAFDEHTTTQRDPS